MDLAKARDMALKLMKKHNVKDWTFKFQSIEEMNTKGRYVLGKCNYRFKNIILSRELTQHEENEDRVRNTILHEIAHALDYNKRGVAGNHDKHWQRIARSIGCAGNKCGDMSKVSLLKVAKWMGRCPNCQKKFYKMIKPKTNLSCGKCGGKNYNPEFKIDYQLNRNVVKTYEKFIERE